jgi:hypothetical protein
LLGIEQNIIQTLLIQITLLKPIGMQYFYLDQNGNIMPIVLIRQVAGKIFPMMIQAGDKEMLN